MQREPIDHSSADNESSPAHIHADNDSHAFMIRIWLEEVAEDYQPGFERIIVQ